MKPEYVHLIRKRLVAWRFGLGLTQRDIAEQSGISIPTISHFESGANIPHSDTIYRIIERGLGMKIEDFLSIEPPEAQRTQRRSSGVPVPNLRQWRKALDVKTKDLAEVCGVQPSTITHIESGGYASRRVAQRIYRGLKLTPEQMQKPPLQPISKSELIASFNPTESEREYARRIMEEASGKVRRSEANAKINAIIESEHEKGDPRMSLDIEMPKPENVPESMRESLDAIAKEVRKKRFRELTE